MNIVFIIHVLLFVSMMIIPFTNNTRNLEAYSIIVPFIFFHWSINDDTCVLTQIEMYVTKNDKHESFFGRLMGPIYKMDNTQTNNLIKTLMFFLWLLVQYRLKRFDAILKPSAHSLGI